LNLRRVRQGDSGFCRCSKCDFQGYGNDSDMKPSSSRVSVQGYGSDITPAVSAVGGIVKVIAAI
jgi:hypothetical protein